MTNETRQVMQWAAAIILVLCALAALAIFVWDNINGRSVDVATSTLLGLLVSFSLTVLGYTGGVANATQATDKANANAAQVVQTANGNAHEVYNALNPAQAFSTVPGAAHATPVPQTPPAASKDGG